MAPVCAHIQKIQADNFLNKLLMDITSILFLLIATAILIFTAVIFYVVWRLKSEKAQGVSSFGWLFTVPKANPKPPKDKKSPQETEHQFHFAERCNADPREFLDKILATEDVKLILECSSMRIENIKPENYRGQFEADLKWEQHQIPIRLTICVFPTAFKTLFCLQAWEQDNSWLPSKIEFESELDPERPEEASKTFREFLHLIYPALLHAELVRRLD